MKKNNLLLDFPELSKQWDHKKNNNKPGVYSRGSDYIAWWICEYGHSYKARIANRTIKNQGCPYCSGRLAGYGNDLKTLYPEIAKEWNYEKNEKNPNEFLPGSGKKVWWLCKKKHSYLAQVDKRTRYGTGCPYCSGRLAGYGNDLKTLYPEIAKEWNYEKNERSPTEYLPYSNVKVWWLCSKGHEWDTSIQNRMPRSKKSGKEGIVSQGCPFCSRQRIGYGNDFATNYPDLLIEWDYKKNAIDPHNIAPRSGKKVWWLCKKKHSYQTSLDNKTKGRGCPFCVGKKVGYGNDFQSKRPTLAKEWDYKKNEKLPSDYSFSSGKWAWWICKNNHSFKQRIEMRYRGAGCPYCSGRLAGYGNDLKTLYPEIAKEWNYEKNKKTPEEFTPYSGKKSWFICSVGHSYNATISNRTRNLSGCPYCTLTPRSKDEIYLLFELKRFFKIKEGDNKIKLDRVNDVDIILRKEKVVIEFDGSYWHKDKAERDIIKTKKLRTKGYVVIRVREKPLKILSRKYNVSSKPKDYKTTANKVLIKLNQLGYEVKDLNKYLKRKTLVNKNNADNYLQELLEIKYSKDKSSII